jgi:dnaD and phage-associated domain protein
MTSGWIKIDRKIIDMEGYFGEKFTRIQCWLDLLLLAEWKDGNVIYIRGNKVVINRGEIAMSIAELCKRWKYSKLTVRKRLQEFVDSGMIVIKKTRIINTITIINYDKYQSVENVDETEVGNFSYNNLNAKSNPQKQSVSNTLSTTYKGNDFTSDPQSDPQTNPLYKKKEKNILLSSSTTHARTHEGFVGELLKEEIWIEQMCMKHKISKVDLEAWLNEFQLDAECRGKKHDNISDAKQHFNDWLRIQLKIKNDADDRKESKIQRRGFERAVSKAEDYTHTF